MALSDQERRLRAVTEKELDQSVHELCDLYGWKRYHTFRSDKSPAGFPDLVLVRERIIYAELKRETANPTREQSRWLEALRQGRGEVYVIRPRDLQQFADILAMHV